MGLHRNARLGLAGRRALVADVEAGLSCRAAARRRGVSPTTACKWWRRWSQATLEQRQTLACLEDRLSRPHRSPRRLPASEQMRICAARRRSGWGPRLIAGETGYPHATVWRTLRRAGISRSPREPRERPRLYEWPCPGDLLHIDSKRFVRFTRPGHALTGERHRTGAEKRMRIGYEWVHSIVDDHSRYAYSELHPDERADTVTAFVERALAHLSEHGIEPKRLLSDNAFVYRHNRSLRELLQAHGIEHRFIRPRRPQTNGKVERYQQTLKREWGLGRVYRSSDHRARALSHWLDYYNTRRPHSSLGDRPPISRVHNLPRQDT
jgi:transposase InsO family protein